MVASLLKYMFQEKRGWGLRLEEAHPQLREVEGTLQAFWVIWFWRWPPHAALLQYFCFSPYFPETDASPRVLDWLFCP
jgi:hypothetical protein